MIHFKKLLQSRKQKNTVILYKNIQVSTVAWKSYDDDSSTINIHIGGKMLNVNIDELIIHPKTQRHG
jgi:hypothetical protein